LTGVTEHPHFGVGGVSLPIIGDDILIGAQVWIVCPHRSTQPKIGRVSSVDDAAQLVMISVLERTENVRRGMVPLYAARIEDLGPGDFVKVDCAACSHTALLAPAFLSRLGLSPRSKVLDLQDQLRCRGCGVRGCAVASIKWAKSAQ
jgi:hypothetical protein